MNGLRAEQAAKLEMITSIAHSQEALARILDSVADVSAHSQSAAKQLSENIRLLTQYQSAMCEMLLGISLHRIKYGAPSSPWLNEDYLSTYDAARGVQEVH